MSKLMRQWIMHALFAHGYTYGEANRGRSDPRCATCNSFEILCKLDEPSNAE